MLKNNKGITLIALVITIIIILILASVATTSGISAVNTAKFNNAKSQFQAMQNYANSWYEESDNNTEVLNYGEDISEKANAEELEKMQNDLSVTNFEDEGFKYFSADYISNTLGIEGISYDFLIKVSDATVLLFGGITYEGYTYYTAEDFGLNLIGDHNLTGEIKFETKIEQEYIVVYKIQFPDDMNISKYKIQYQDDGERYWKTLTTDKRQEYEYKDASGNTVKDKNAWKILIPTINEEFFSNSQPIEGEDRELALLNIKIRIIATEMASQEKTHTIVKRKETIVATLTLDKTDIIMPIGGTRKIIVTPTLNEEIVYYAKINDNYYKIEKNAEGKYVVQENITEIKDEVFELKADLDKDNVTISINQENNEITLTGTKIDDSVMTVTFGEVRPKTATCNVQVLSKLDYLDKLLENEDDISDDIIENVKDDGYIIKKIIDTRINDITLNYPVAMSTNYTETITVLCDKTEISYYYAEINGNYYKIIKNDSKIIVEKTPTTISEESYELNATSSDTSYIAINSISGMNISIKSGSSTGNATITVSYAGITKTCTIEVRIMPTKDSVADGTTTFSTEYGTIDVIWISTENQVIPEPNPPELFLGTSDPLTPVTWTLSGSWSEDSTIQTPWYSYTSNGTDRTNNTTSMWANAKNADGSYFVWIPRYAYRITYYESKSSTTPTGYYDGWGQWRASDAKVKVYIDEGIEIVEHNGYKYIVHPAFMKDTNKNDKNGNALSDYDRGGWDSELTGFWTAKYEMSREGATSSNAGGSGLSGYKFKSVPTVRSVSGGGTVSDKYTISLNYDSLKNSHLMKNSEWGAIAYLTHSQYGRNGNEIYVNNHQYNVTGIGGSSTTASKTTSTTNKYNTTTGVKSSTTGNVYGVYDMSGGGNENVACWNAYSSDESLTNANVFAKNGGVSTKYATAYKNSGDDGGNAVFFASGKVGDATKEVYGEGNSFIATVTENGLSWFDDGTQMVHGNYPLMLRGGMYQGSGTGISLTKNAGVFAIFKSNGTYSYSFRVTLCPY